MDRPLVTVLIDTYNHGRFIEEAVGSALQQNFPRHRMEILVVDDGSTDDTAARLQSLSAEIRYFKKRNGGQASALNYGFREARGDIIALLDGDDSWAPTKLSKVVAEFEKDSDVALVYHQFRILGRAGDDWRESNFALVSGYVPRCRKTLLQYHIFPTSSLTFRRCFVEQVLPIPEDLLIQADAYLAATIIFTGPVGGPGECLTDYRVHDGNLYQFGESRFPREVVERRLKTRGAVIQGVKAWLASRGYDAREPNLSGYLNQWHSMQEYDQFRLEAPGRLRLFRRLWRDARTYHPIRTRRHRIVSYLDALSSLVTGYRSLRGSFGRAGAVRKRIGLRGSSLRAIFRKGSASGDG